MKLKLLIAAASILCCNLTCLSQNRNSIWCFGDSAGIDFSNLSNPVTFPTAMDGRGSCVSISDTSGDLLFYAATILSIGNAWATVVFNRNHQVMQNGDSIVGLGWYHELIIVPDPANNNLYYLFSIGGIGTNVSKGLFYSVIDMTLDGGNGAVTIKNFQLENFNMVDCLTAVKHGNGRDWWLIFRKSDYLTFGGNNDWYSYLISPDGITNFNQQSIGSLNRTGLGQIDFSVTGNKLAFTCLTGVLEVFDFDRCTGLLSNPVTIEQDPFAPPYNMNISVAFSHDATRLYSSSITDPSYLLQYNLLDTPNITLSKDTIWQISRVPHSLGKIRLMDDNKIYVSCAYYNGINFNYPYPDSIRNFINENLSVINSPDSLGALCDFQPFSFYLGGKRTYYGLPNNPDYDMPALAGSPCDTLTGIANIEQGISNAELFVTWKSEWQKLHVNAQKLKGRNVTVEVFDVAGKNLTGCCHAEVRGISQNSYFTKDIFLPNLAAGMYVVKLQTEKEMLAKKFVVE